MTQIPSLLARWAAKQPTVCKHHQVWQGRDRYTIGEYSFWFLNGELGAEFGPEYHCYGQPALDWLEGVTRRAIEAMGCDYEQFHDSRLIKIGQQHNAKIEGRDYSKSSDRATALLQSLVEYLEAQNG